MTRFDWGAEQDEQPEIVEAALKTVRLEGAKKRLRRRTIALSSMGTAALVVIVGAFSLNSTDATSTPSIELATKVTHTATAALADVKSISATERFSSNDPTNVVPADYTGTTYRLAEDGSYFMAYSGTDEEGKHTYQEAYSATTGKSERCTELSGAQPDCVVTFQQGPEFKPLFRTFANIMDAAAKSGNATAVSTTDNGRKVWTVEFDSKTPLFFSTIDEHIVVIVDQQSGLPFHYTISDISENAENNAPIEISVNDIKTNVTFAASEMKVVRPSGAILHDGAADATSEEGEVFGKTFSPAATGKLPFGSVNGWAGNETWTIPRAIYVSHGSCGDTTLYADSLLRKGLLTANVEVIDFSKCPNERLDMQEELGEIPASLQLSGFVATSKIVKTITATQGALQGTTFEIYSTGQGQYAMGGQSSKVRVFVDGNLNVDELSELANSFRL